MLHIPYPTSGDATNLVSSSLTENDNSHDRYDHEEGCNKYDDKKDNDDGGGLFPLSCRHAMPWDEHLLRFGVLRGAIR
jgi:hypothetical protein